MRVSGKGDAFCGAATNLRRVELADFSDAMAEIAGPEQ